MSEQVDSLVTGLMRFIRIGWEMFCLAVIFGAGTAAQHPVLTAYAGVVAGAILSALVIFRIVNSINRRNDPPYAKLPPDDP